MKSVIATFIATIAAIIVSTIVLIFSGIFNVSAQREDPTLLRWLLVSTREASVEKRAQQIEAPVLSAIGQVENGFRSYREMCAVCHTPPGGSKSPIAQGLNPSPPDLARVKEHAMSDSEVFWVIKNGIRMTGMPAWGRTHDDAEIWDIVAFVKALPNIDAAAYRELDSRTSAGHSHADTSHDNKTDDHMDTGTHGH